MDIPAGRNHRISVIVPARNASSTIRQCLESIKSQRYPYFEAVVVDDNSEDDTFQIAERIFNTIRLEKWSGAGAARNAGASNSSGEILLFVDSDCVFNHDFLEKVNNVFIKGDVDILSAGYDEYLDDNIISKFNFMEISYRRRNLSGRYVNSISSQAVAIKKEVFCESGGFREYIVGAGWEDMELSLTIDRKYRILWKDGMGIGHHFKTSLLGYLRQQQVSASGSILLIIKYPEMLKKRTLESSSYAEAILTSFMLVFIILSFADLAFLYPAAITTMLLIILNIKYFMYMNHLFNVESRLLLRMIPLVILRNLNWMISIPIGILYYFRHLIGKKIKL